MSIKAKLIIDEKEVNVLYYDYGFRQPTNSNGFPSEKTVFAGLNLIVETRKDLNLADWASATNQPKQLELHILPVVMGSKTRKLYFYDCHLIGWKNSFTHTGSQSMTETLEITAAGVKDSDARDEYSAYWRETFSKRKAGGGMEASETKEEQEEVEVSKLSGEKNVFKGGIHEFKVKEFTKQGYELEELVEKVKWKYRIDDGELKSIEEKATIRNKEIVLDFEIPEDDGKKIKVFAFIENFSIEVNFEAELLNSGKAILIAFPEDDPEIPENQETARWFEENFGDGDHRMQNAGHAGIIIITMVDEGEYPKGISKYFDFGRYNLREEKLGKRGKNQGVVRSSDFSSAFRISDWDFEKTDFENAKIMMQELLDQGKFIGYGKMIGAVAENLKFNEMMEYALYMKNRGNIPFGGYLSSTNKDHSTYCAKFARGVAEAGGMDWDWDTFSGEGNVEDIIETYKGSMVKLENE